MVVVVLAVIAVVVAVVVVVVRGFFIFHFVVYCLLFVFHA